MMRIAIGSRNKSVPKMSIIARVRADNLPVTMSIRTCSLFLSV